MAKKKLHGTLDKQLKIYSAVAAGVLALAPSAEAARIYSGLQNLPVNPSTSQIIDLNGDGTSDFVFKYNGIYLPKGPYLYGTHNASLILNGSLNCYHAAIRLASNYQIKSTLVNPNFIWRPNTYGNLNGTLTNNCKQNFNNATGFIGVRFHTLACPGTNFSYGWIRYRGDTVSSGTIVDWEYEDTCNTPIAAGATAEFISKNDGTCSGNNPCFTVIQTAIDSANGLTDCKITQDTYAENITVDANQWVIIRGGWDVNFTSNSSSYTTIQGSPTSLTITGGMAIVENIILE